MFCFGICRLPKILSETISQCKSIFFITASQGIHPNSNLPIYLSIYLSIYLGSLAISKTPRHVDELTKLLKNMDAEYDKCNMVCANGEVNGYNSKPLYCKETSIPNINCMCMNRCGIFDTPVQSVFFTRWHLGYVEISARFWPQGLLPKELLP